MQIFHKLLFWAFSVNINSVSPSKIAVVYYTDVSSVIKENIIQNIKGTYNCSITSIDQVITIPSDAYYKPRNRYRASVILQHLDKISGYDKIIAITDKDISATKNEVYDWGIMGLATIGGKSCIISTYRLRTKDKKVFEDRVIKVALHELGHTMGLDHCTYSRTCFMEAAEGTIKSVDRETRSLCEHCKKLLRN